MTTPLRPNRRPNETARTTVEELYLHTVKEDR